VIISPVLGARNPGPALLGPVAQVSHRLCERGSLSVQSSQTPAGGWHTYRLAHKVTGFNSPLTTVQRQAQFHGCVTWVVPRAAGSMPGFTLPGDS
jgi:hypothetical protein